MSSRLRCRHEHYIVHIHLSNRREDLSERCIWLILIGTNHVDDSIYESHRGPQRQIRNSKQARRSVSELDVERGVGRSAGRQRTLTRCGKFSKVDRIPSCALYIRYRAFFQNKMVYFEPVLYNRIRERNVFTAIAVILYSTCTFQVVFVK